MTSQSLTLCRLPGRFAVCRLPPEAPVPTWASAGAFCSVTRTANELSVICPEAVVPGGVCREGGWACLEVEGPLDFSLVGVLASLTGPLARAGISVFALSTFDTDYLLVREEAFSEARDVLEAEGHRVG